MRNRSILWIFVILLSLAVLYSLSFGWVASNYEKKVHQMAVDSVSTLGLEGEAADIAVYELERKMLRDSSEGKAYPFFDHSYSYLKQRELNLGLDLKGGMSVTLEVSIPDLLVALSDNNEDPTFNQAIKNAVEAQKNSREDFMTLFEKAWNEQNSGKELWTIFNNYENEDKFPAKASDADIMTALRKEAQDAIDNTENIIKKRIDQFGVTQPNVQKQSLTGRILVELPGVSDRERVRKNLKSTANLEFWNTYFNAEVLDVIARVDSNVGRSLAPELYGLKSINDSTIAVDSTGVVADSALTRDQVRKKFPLRSMLALVNPNASLSSMVGYAKVSDTSAINKVLSRPEARMALAVKPDLRLLWGAKPNANTVSLYAIKDPSMKKKAELDGKSIIDARQDFDPTTGDVTVEMTMDAQVGAPKWKEMTKKNAGDNNRAIAIVMDNLVYSAPSVNSEIPNGRSVITFGTGERAKQIEEAQDLAGLLKAGSLPAPAKIVDEVTVGPTLGEENITAGLWSFAMAFAVILIYMVFYYAWAGWAANVALIANLFFLIGALISLGGSLTLPGIAGIVLTMGMAVDANVLIYERVKEELRMGKPTAAAMNDGFLKAISAIIDGNATTLITGIVLLVIGTGPIKGFATTLIIGIFTTLFTAIIISRLILYRRLDSKKPITFYSNITKNWFTKVNYDFVTKRKLYYTISIVIIAAGMISWVTRGFNMGVDFAGGTSFKVEFENKVNVDDLRNALSSTLIEENGNAAALSVQSIGSDGKSFKITTNYLIDSKSTEVDNLVEAKVKEAFAKVNVAYNPGFSSYKVDPTMSDDFRTEAFWSTLIGLILVGIYIFIRFQKWDFAVGAAAALLHDALIVIAAFTLLNGLVPFSMEVNQNFIGAILTVIGYSINDTVVIFDRIREYFNTRRNPELKSTINDALNSTLGRSINTSMTVLLTLLVMFFFGSDDIKGFCFAMIVGVVSGVYSTLFIATPIVVDMRNWLGKKEKSA